MSVAGVAFDLDDTLYPKGIKISNAQIAAINLSRHAFHGDWNYTIAPRQKNAPRRKAI